MKFPYLPQDHIEQAAAETLTGAFGEDVPYPLDLDFLVYEHLGDRDHLIFDNEQDLGMVNGEVVLGKTLPLSREVMITAGLREEHQGRYRFTVAHEIGHWVLHRPLFLAEAGQPGLFDSPPQEEQIVSLHRDVFPKNSGRARVPTEEWQANQFAAALLINRRVLQESFAERFGPSPIERRTGAGLRAPSLRALSRALAGRRVRDTPPLNEIFGVSVEAMAVALESRGYVVEDAPLL